MKTIKFAVAGVSIAAVIISTVGLIQGNNELHSMLLIGANSIFATYQIGSALDEN